MSDALIVNQQLAPSYDPARHYADAEPWSTEWRYRFVPPTQLVYLDFYSDHGLEHLLYLQFLISDEVECGEPALG